MVIKWNLRKPLKRFSRKRSLLNLQNGLHTEIFFGINLRNGWIKKETVEKVQQEEKSFKPSEWFTYRDILWHKPSERLDQERNR